MENPYQFFNFMNSYLNILCQEIHLMEILLLDSKAAWKLWSLNFASPVCDTKIRFEPWIVEKTEADQMKVDLWENVQNNYEEVQGKWVCKNVMRSV